MSFGLARSDTIARMEGDSSIKQVILLSSCSISASLFGIMFFVIFVARESQLAVACISSNEAG